MTDATLKQSSYPRTRQIMRVVAEACVEGVEGERAYALRDAARAAIETMEDELDNGPDLALLAKALRCGPNAPWAKLLEVAEGAVRRAENAERSISEAQRDAERWRKARQFLAVEDIEDWAGPGWRGHEPNEYESRLADGRIDAIEAPK